MGTVEREGAEELPDRRAAYARAGQHLGAFRERDAASDVSERHDDYLADVEPLGHKERGAGRSPLDVPGVGTQSRE